MYLTVNTVLLFHVCVGQGCNSVQRERDATQGFSQRSAGQVLRKAIIYIHNRKPADYGRETDVYVHRREEDAQIVLADIGLTVGIYLVCNALQAVLIL